MDMFHLISLVQIIIGAVMLLSIVVGLEIRNHASRYLRTKWLVIIILTAFFFLGYIAVIFIPILKLSFPLELLIGSVFLGGSFFVYLVMSITRITIHSIHDKEREITEFSGKMSVTIAGLRETNGLLEMEIGERLRSEEALRKSEGKYRSLVESTADSIYVIDRDYQYLFVNQKHLKRLGIFEDNYIGKSYADFHSPGITSKFTKIVDQVFTKGESTQLEHLSERDNEYYLLTLSPVKERDGEITAVTVVSKRVTDLKRMEQKLRDLSLTDELTGLYNRRGLFTLAEQQIRMAKRNKNKVYMLYADMDDLKVINDTHGHEEGDLAIIETAKILKESFRDSDIIARIGGDEFVTMPIGTNESEAKMTIDRLHENLEVSNTQKNRSYKLSLSVGVAYYDPKHPSTINELLVQGDGAMYGNKKHRKAQAEAY